MSVCLGNVGSFFIYAADYDAEKLRIEYENEDVDISFEFDRKELQQLSKIIDRFMER